MKKKCPCQTDLVSGLASTNAVRTTILKWSPAMWRTINLKYLTKNCDTMRSNGLLPEARGRAVLPGNSCKTLQGHWEKTSNNMAAK